MMRMVMMVAMMMMVMMMMMMMMITRNIKPKQPPFMNAALYKVIMNKERLQHKTPNFPNSTNWDNFRQKRNLVTKIKRKSIRTYFRERCPDNGSSHPKTFWDTVHPFFSDNGVKWSDNIQLLEGDTLLTKPTDVANVMNEYFTNITSAIVTHFHVLNDDILM